MKTGIQAIVVVLLLSVVVSAPQAYLAQDNKRLDQIDWRKLIVEQGELPRQSVTGTTSTLPGKYRTAKLAPVQKFISFGLSTGSIDVFVMDSEDDADLAWSEIGSLMTTEAAKYDDDIGDMAKYETLIVANVPFSQNFVFFRCRAVVAISVASYEMPEVIRWARNLDSRLKNTVCF